MKRYVSIIIAVICFGDFIIAQQPVNQPKKIGDFIESTSLNEDRRGSKRFLQYRPDGRDFVSINGKNRYTRALYGSHTDFRIETSDRPIFATFKKNNNKNIRLVYISGKDTVPLENTEFCEARYTPGRRSYVLKDRRLTSDACIRISVLASFDEEAAIWKITAENLQKNAVIKAIMTPCKNQKLNRNGDMGVDPPDSFDPSDSIPVEKITDITTGYLLFADNQLSILPDKKGSEYYENAEKARKELAERIVIRTPDSYINTLGGALSIAADGIWDGEVWQHGAVGWRMPLSGWRAAYVGDVMGWHDRARTHFDAYAASQVTDVPPVYPHPTQDSALHLARAEKRWGTQMYSNGYICRNPYRNDQMHHYDMNLCYIDELLWHFLWTGDTAYVRKMWPVLERHTAWEKRNFDPDDDGLYDAYCCIWASDALYYGGGGVTHSSAYNYRANHLIAKLAGIIGKDPGPYRKEAEKIRKAMNERLWLKKEGHWAEYQESMGHKRVYEHAGIWTIYHAIDSEVGDDMQNYQSTLYIDDKIPHIPVVSDDLEEKDLATISTTNWLPYSWSINNVANAEVTHTALAYWQAGRNEEAFKLFKANIIDGMYLSSSPGNFGQVSFYDAARGECYRDFGDPVGIASRALIQGLYGVRPNLLDGVVKVVPGFPSDWEYASLKTPYINYSFSRKNNIDFYDFSLSFARPASLTLEVRALYENADVFVNGKAVAPEWKEGAEYAKIVISTLQSGHFKIEIRWKGDRRVRIRTYCNEENYNMSKPFVNLNVSQCEPVHLDTYFNDSLTNIFDERYFSPRPPYTTLQIPVQGIGEWCHPLLTAEIDDSGVREKTVNNVFTTSNGIPLRTPKEGNNIIFTTLWDNFPDSATIPLNGYASNAYLLLAGTTNHLQSHIVNGLITVYYKDGSSNTLELINPENWCPIEQDYFVDDKAFRIKAPRPYRLHFKSGLLSDDLEKELNITGVYGREIPGGAGVLLDMLLDGNKELDCLKVETVSNDILVGLMSVTLQRLN
jgi:hypothetical protein